MRLCLPLLLLLTCLVEVSSVGSLQSIAVKGKLMCNQKPYAQVKVKLWEVDLADPDDLLDETRTKKDGTFYLAGNETELSEIEPKINIYHNCVDEQTECLRKVEIIIPSNQVTYGAKPNGTFDIGTLNLNAIYPGESRDCHN